MVYRNLRVSRLVIALAASLGMTGLGWAGGPVAGDQVESTAVLPQMYGISLNYDNPSGNALEFRLLRAPEGSVTYWDYTTSERLSLTTNKVVMSPYWYYSTSAAEPGVDSFEWEVRDSEGHVSSATVLINLTNNSPVTLSSQTSTLPVGAFRSPVDQNHTDPDEYQMQRYRLLDAPARGLLEHHPGSEGDDRVVIETNTWYCGGVWEYTPQGMEPGEDSFVWQASDGLSTSTLETVAYSLTTNTPPAVSDGTMFVAFGSVRYRLWMYHIELDRDQPEIFQLVVPPEEGILEYQDSDENYHRIESNDWVASDTWYYTPTNTPPPTNVNVFATNTVVWRMSDGIATSETATATMKMKQNYPPLANDQTGDLVTGTIRACTLSYTDIDSYQPFAFRLAAPPDHGIIEYPVDYVYVPVPTNVYITSRQWRYRSDPGYTGTDTFEWQVSDGVTESEPAIYTLSVIDNSPATAYGLRMVVSPNGSITKDTRWTDANSGQHHTAHIATPPGHGSVTVSGDTVSYTPDTDYTGEDSFSYTIYDGISHSSPALARVQVRESDDRAGNLILVIVRDSLYPELSNEVHRLEQDLIADGYTAEIHTRPNDSAANMWNHIKGVYDNTNHWLEGALLIGSLPRPQVRDDYYGIRDIYTDLPLWNMNFYQTEGSVLPHDFRIWVGRFYAAGNSYGDEATLLRRALDANHAARTGRARLPHDAYFYHAWNSPIYTSVSSNLLEVWPLLTATNEVGTNSDKRWGAHFNPVRNDDEIGAPGGADALVYGGDIFQETSHGNPRSYMYGKFNRDGLMRVLSQQRYTIIESCTAGGYGSIANHHILTRGGGTIFAVGGSVINWQGDFQVANTSEDHIKMRDYLAEGESWGSALVRSYAFRAFNRTLFHGDLSLPVMATESNAMPRIVSFTREPDGPVYPGQPVSFSIQVDDPDTSLDDSPYVDFEHQVEWFMHGYNAGRNDPTYTTNDAQSATWTNIVHAFPAVGTYTVRAEVMDEWQARAWREMTVTVTSDPPLAVDDTAETLEDTPVVIAVLTNDSDPNGDAIFVQDVSDPPCGTATHDGTNVTYTPDANYFGTDYFTYTVRDEWGKTDSAVVSVTVLSQPDIALAVDDTANTFPDTSVVVNVLANDSDPDGVGLSLLSVTQGAHGSVAYNQGNATYTPNHGFEGEDTFTYTLVDGRGNTASATVTVEVVQAQPALELEPDADTHVNAGEHANDNYGANTSLAVKYTGSTPGNYTRRAYIRFDLASVQGLVTSALFRVYCSPWSGSSDTHKVSVGASNDWLEDEMTWNTQVGVSNTTLGTWSSSPAGFRELDITAAVQEALDSEKKLTLVITQTTQDNGAGYVSRESTNLHRRPGLVLLSAAGNDPPIARDDFVWTPRDNAVAIDVLANDVEPNGNGLVVKSVSQGAYGSVSNEGVRICYTPPPAFEGTNVFDYVVSDGMLCDTGTVTVAVGPAHPRLALHWAMNEAGGDTLIDESGYGHTGTLAGAAQRMAGPWGGAVAFDGIDAYAETADSSALDVQALTAACRVYVRSLDIASGVLISKDGSYAMGVDADGSLMCGLATGGGWQWTDSDVPVPVNLWTHLAVTYDGAAISYYVDGQLRATRTPAADGAIQASAAPLRIAAAGTGAAEALMACALDDVRIYSAALDIMEIMGQAEPADHDRDGLPDDADPDDDNDGMSDADELRAGTDPRDAASLLAIETSEMEPDGDGFVLRWQSSSGRCYRVEARTNLLASPGIWIATNLIATPPLNSYTDRVERGSSVFYSITVEDEQ